MSTFLEKHADKIQGTLSGCDRMLVSRLLATRERLRHTRLRALPDDRTANPASPPGYSHVCTRTAWSRRSLAPAAGASLPQGYRVMSAAIRIREQSFPLEYAAALAA
jgi:hypothetical protein